MKKLLLSLCLFGSTCFGEMHTLSRYQIHLTDNGIFVDIGEDYYTAEYVIYSGDGFYYADIYPLEFPIK